jgi:hypothetical protein
VGRAGDSSSRLEWPTKPHHVYPLGWSLVQDDDVEGMRTRTLYFL